jgi:hypothetical protein
MLGQEKWKSNDRDLEKEGRAHSKFHRKNLAVVLCTK